VSAACNGPAKPPKWQRILQHFVDGHDLDRFRAERLGDHVLNTTVSQLANRGIVVSREPITIEGRFGSIACNRYWLEPEQRERARRLLGGL
jgi:hypothetical protein